MKPDWKEAPEWANWFAMNELKQWYWFENKPKQYSSYWDPKTGRLGFVNDHDWRDTLEPRPSSQGQENDLVWRNRGIDVFACREWEAEKDGFEFNIIDCRSNITLICQSSCNHEYFKHETFKNIKSLKKAKALAEKWLEENK